MRTIAILSLLVLATCGDQELLAYCDQEGLDCPPCSSNAECVVLSNACHETASCVHRDDDTVAVTMDGCNWSYDVPPDSECVCTESVCLPRD
jgi:hypothetical protein